MKISAKLIICAVIIIILGFVFVWSNHILKATSQEVSQPIDTAIAFVQNDNWEGACEKIESARKKWHEIRAYISIVLEHSYINEIDVFLESALSDAKTQDYSSFMRNAENIKHNITNMLTVEQMLLENLF
jgi:hypothetical protein